MPSSRTARTVARFVLAWFALYLGAAVAAPLLTPGGYAVICSADGIARVVQTDDAGEPDEARASCTARLRARGRAAARCRARGNAAAAAALRAAVGAGRLAGGAQRRAAAPARGPPPSI